MQGLGCENAIGFDAGGSTSLCVGGKTIYTHTNDRVMKNILYW
jgi:exopolysaccharide biosynthesis protein